MHAVKCASYYIKQSACKPGSVPLAGCLSFIYTVHHCTAKAFYPPTRTSNPQTPVYANLQLPRHTARTSPHDRWALTPPSHPYLLRGGYFLLHYSAFADSFLLGSGMLCAARTFLLYLDIGNGDRPSDCILSAKIQQTSEKYKACFNIFYSECSTSSLKIQQTSEKYYSECCH